MKQNKNNITQVIHATTTESVQFLHVKIIHHGTKIKEKNYATASDIVN